MLGKDNELPSNQSPYGSKAKSASRGYQAFDSENNLVGMDTIHKKVVITQHSQIPESFV
jgi:hypothetical protein